MLSKRAIVVSGDKLFAKRLAAGLLAAGTTVETVASPDELPAGTLRAELVVVNLTLDAIGRIEAFPPRLADGAALIGVIPTPSIELTVELMKTKAVAAVLVAADYQPSQLSAIASRLLYGDIFGLEKIVPWGVKVYSLLVGDYQEKSVAIATVSEFAEAMGVRRKYREAVEQCLDELLMNALYDAPVDAEGKQMFADVPTKTRISLRMEQKAVVQYACDGTTFALSVRDSFGTLSRDTVVRFLDKCLHSEQQIDRKAGGAGLGLYLISNAASAFRFGLYPGIATEVTCTFDLTAAKVQLNELGFFSEKIDAAGRLVGGVSRLVPRAAPPAPIAPSRALVGLLGGAIALIFGLIAVVAWPRLRSRPRTTLAVTTAPPGATVEVDGVSRGPSPVTVSDLDVGQKVQVAARLDGYQPAVELVLPQQEPGKVALTLAPLPATLVVTSRPPGATATLDRKERGVTPLTATDLAPGSEHALVLQKPGYQPAARTLEAPGPGTRREVEVALTLDPETSLVRLASVPAGAEIYQNAEIIGGIKTPAEHLIRAGRSYTFTLKLPGYKPEVRTVTARRGVPADPVEVKLVPGGTLTISVNLPEARLSVIGAPACQNRPTPLECPLADGTYKVRLFAGKPHLGETIEVTIRGADLTRRVDVGFIQVASPELSLSVPGAATGTKRAAFLEGEVKLAVVPAKGVPVLRTVRVQAGKTATVDAK